MMPIFCSKQSIPQGIIKGKYHTVKLSPGGSFAPLCSPGTVYVWCCIHVAPYTCDAVYAWSHIRMEPYMHGAVYAWSCICMELYTCGASSLPLLPACSPCSLSIPGSLELSWGLRNPQLTPLASSLLPSIPACSPYSLSIHGPLGPSWSLRKPPAHSPCSQLAALAP